MHPSAERMNEVVCQGPVSGVRVYPFSSLDLTEPVLCGSNELCLWSMWMCDSVCDSDILRGNRQTEMVTGTGTWPLWKSGRASRRREPSRMRRLRVQRLVG